MIWVSGQVDLTPGGVVCNEGDIAQQAMNTMTNFATVLAECDASLGDLVKLLCFYVHDGARTERDVLEMVAAALPEGPGPAVTMVPVPYLAYPGMDIEIEGYAMRPSLKRHRIAPAATSPLPGAFCEAIRCGRMIFVSGQTPIDETGALVAPRDAIAQTHQSMRQIRSRLAAFGADFVDVVKSNRWYAGHGTILAALGADYADVCKVTTVYEGGCSHDDLHENLSIRSGYFEDPGPATTGIPLPKLAYPAMVIEIEIFAMADPDG